MLESPCMSEGVGTGATKCLSARPITISSPSGKQSSMRCCPCPAFRQAWSGFQTKLMSSGVWLKSRHRRSGERAAARRDTSGRCRRVRIRLGSGSSMGGRHASYGAHVCGSKAQAVRRLCRNPVIMRRPVPKRAKVEGSGVVDDGVEEKEPGPSDVQKKGCG